jgi:hypothetical protein
MPSRSPPKRKQGASRSKQPRPKKRPSIALDRLCSRWQLIHRFREEYKRDDDPRLAELEVLLREHLKTGRAYDKLEGWLQEQRPAHLLVLQGQIQDIVKVMERCAMSYDDALATEPGTFEIAHHFAAPFGIDEERLREACLDSHVMEKMGDKAATAKATDVICSLLGLPSRRAGRRRVDELIRRKGLKMTRLKKGEDPTDLFKRLLKVAEAIADGTDGDGATTDGGSTSRVD